MLIELVSNYSIITYHAERIISMDNEHIVTFTHAATLHWPFYLMAGVGLVLILVLSPIRDKIRGLLSSFILMALGIVMTFAGILLASHMDNKAVDNLKHSVEKSYSATVHGQGGKKGNTFKGDAKENIVLEDKSGKMHQCLFVSTEHRDTVDKYYVQCADNTKVLTPGKPLQ